MPFAQTVGQFVLVDRIDRFDEVDALSARPDQHRHENDEFGLSNFPYQLETLCRMFRSLADMAGVDNGLRSKRQTGHECVRVRLESVFLGRDGEADQAGIKVQAETAKLMNR